MRNLIAVSTAVAISALLSGFSPAALAQTWVETHPALIDAASRAPSPDVQTVTQFDEMLKPYREARVQPDAASKPDDGAEANKGPLDHPANANGESNRHE